MSTEQELKAIYRGMVVNYNALGAGLERIGQIAAAAGIDLGGGGAVIPPADPSKPIIPPSAGMTDRAKQAKCYLDRYHDVRAAGKKRGLNEQQGIEWAERHFNEWGQREGRVWGCITAPDGVDSTTGLKSVHTIGNGFVWKPEAETTHALVILDSYGQPKKDVRIEWSGGSETGHWRDTEGHNGGRMHYWFKQHGSKYPAPVTLVLGGVRYSVANPGSRYG